jgi:hypothetical protein
MMNQKEYNELMEELMEITGQTKFEIEMVKDGRRVDYSKCDCPIEAAQYLWGEEKVEAVKIGKNRKLTIFLA